MKRNLLLISLCALLCALLFAMPAMAEEECQHTVYCYEQNNAVTYCAQCGEDVTNVSYEITHSPMQWSDADYHWDGCGWCDAVFSEKTPHTLVSVPDDQWECAGQCTDCDLRWTAYHDYNYDQLGWDTTSCWYECTRCKQKQPDSTGAHTSQCTAPDVCLRCGNTGVTMAEIYHWEDCQCCDHETMREEITKEATCTETGLKNIVCDTCSKILHYAALVPAAGHTEEIIAGKEATCTETGLTDGKKCSVCQVTTVAQEIIPATGHTEEIVAGKAATCTETGLTDGKKCSVCQVTTMAQEIIPVLAHDSIYRFDSNNHWLFCTSCNEIQGNVEAHNVPEEYQYDADYHWRECTVCFLTLDSNNHRSGCEGPATDDCMVCNAKNVSVMTYHEYGEWYYDQDICYPGCIYCQQMDPAYGAPTKHRDNGSGACMFCNQTNVTFACTHPDEKRSWLFDDKDHWLQCECGEELTREAHNVIDGACEFWLCGYTEPVECPHDRAHFIRDDQFHWLECSYCNAVLSEKEAHNVPEEYLYDNDYHWQECTLCYQSFNGNNHRGVCDGPETDDCIICDAKNVPVMTYHGYGEWYYDQDICYPCCIYCQQMDPAYGAPTKHRDNGSGACMYCQQTNVTFACTHPEEKRSWLFDDDEHWLQCECGEEMSGSREAHTVVDGACEFWLCGYTEPVECPHSDTTVSIVKNETCTAAGQQEIICSDCGEVVSTATIPARGHAYSTHFNDQQHWQECARCGDATAPQNHEMNPDGVCHCGAKQLIHVHEKWHRVILQPTCTENGVDEYYCPGCDAILDQTALSALGHALTTQDMGDYQLESCSRCDYEKRIEKEVEIPAQQPIILPEEIPAQVMENVVAESAGKTVQIVVKEVVDEHIPAVLPAALPEEIVPVKVISVFLTEETTTPETVKIALTVDEADITALEGMRLVLILTDGTMVEIPYVIEEGCIVFETQLFGVFAFVPAE